MKKFTYGLALPVALAILAAGCEKAPSLVGSVDHAAPAAAAGADVDLSTVDGTLYGFPNAKGFDWDRAVAQQAEDLAGGRVTQALGTAVPTSFDFSSTFNQPIEDQGKISSCTAFATKAAVEYMAGKTGGSWSKLSALDLYYNTRMKAKKSAASDSGATLKDTLDVLTAAISTDSFGVAPKTGQGYGIGCLLDSDWSYSTTATYSVKVTDKVSKTLLKYQVAPQEGASASLIPDASRSAFVMNYTPVRIVNPTQGGTVRVMREYLANKYPLVIGAKILWSTFLTNPEQYKNAASASINTTGAMSMPGVVAKDRVYGAHAFMVVGYDDTKTYLEGTGTKQVTKKGMFKLRSSWGTGYSSDGYYWMPYDYVTTSNVAEIWALNDFKSH